jgi:DNA-binding Xre family transcriptional regulator
LGLKDLRLAKGYNRTELAKVSGIRYQKIRDIEVGIIKHENITLKTALKLAQALDCQPEDLTKPDKEESDV